MFQKHKVLLSAYACEPNRGSEPGVGWNWAIEIAKRGHDVVVLTRKNNREVIESNENTPFNLNFIYYDLPSSLMWLKKVFGVQLYYFLWQIGACFFVKKQNTQKQKSSSKSRVPSQNQSSHSVLPEAHSTRVS